MISIIVDLDIGMNIMSLIQLIVYVPTPLMENLRVQISNMKKENTD